MLEIHTHCTRINAEFARMDSPMEAFVQGAWCFIRIRGAKFGTMLWADQASRVATALEALPGNASVQEIDGRIRNARAGR